MASQLPFITGISAFRKRAARNECMPIRFPLAFNKVSSATWAYHACGNFLCFFDMLLARLFCRCLRKTIKLPFDFLKHLLIKKNGAQCKILCHHSY